MADGGLEQGSQELVPEAKPCSFYRQGRCRFGGQCRNLHPPLDTESPLGQEKPPRGAARGDEKPPMDRARGDEKPPMDRARGDEKPPMDRARGDEKPPMDRARGDEKLPMDRAAGTEELPNPMVGAKKAPMRTAGAVISRLRWDLELRHQDFTVGYLDRFLGLVEQPFGAFSWGDLASAEPGVLAIPEHRIQYFKHRGRTVWDKGRRLDDIFGSTGSGRTIRQLLGGGQDGGQDGGQECTQDGRPLHDVKDGQFDSRAIGDSVNYITGNSPHHHDDDDDGSRGNGDPHGADEDVSLGNGASSSV